MRLFALAFVLIGACSPTTEHVNAYTLESCNPDKTYMPKKPKKHPNGKCQGTSNGDNCDDLSSGKIDCIGDGNSGQGDDKKHNCMFPQPGCDEHGCCDDDLVDDKDENDGDGDGDGDGGGGGGTGGGDNGGGGGGGDGGPVLT